MVVVAVAISISVSAKVKNDLKLDFLICTLGLGFPILGKYLSFCTFDFFMKSNKEAVDEIWLIYKPRQNLNKMLTL